MSVLLRLLRFLLPFRRQVALATMLGAAAAASTIGLLGIAGYLIATAAAKHLMALLIIPIYLVRTLSVTRGVARYAERLIAHNVTFRVLGALRVWLYDRLTVLGSALVLAQHSGDTLSRILADVEELQNAYLRSLSPFAVATLIAILLAVVLRLFAPVLAWVTLGYLGIAGIGIPLLVRVLSQGCGRSHLVARSELNSHLVDSLQGVQDILSNGSAEAQLQRVDRLNHLVGRAQRKMALISSVREGLSDLVTNLAVLTALALTISLVTERSIAALYVAVPALLVLAGFEVVQPLGLAAQSFGHVEAAGTRVLSLAADRFGTTGVAGPIPSGSLEFDHVSFIYPGSSRPTLSDITFTVPRGARIAIVGPSGAGKTTLAQLVLRSWDASGGRISFGGNDIQAYEAPRLHSAIGIVAQHTYIFNDTIRQNLLLARPHAEERDIMDALEVARLSEFVRSLPDGLDTQVGEHGTRLSGGERQRLAIARMVLKDAPLLILDEATANLDRWTEREVLEALHGLMQGRATLMITHRLVMMERMDEILVLNRGRIVQRGSHDQLRAQQGFYRSMLDVQDNMLSSPA